MLSLAHLRLLNIHGLLPLKQHASTQCSFAKVVGLTYTFWKQEHVKNVLHLASYPNFFRTKQTRVVKIYEYSNSSMYFHGEKCFINSNFHPLPQIQGGKIKIKKQISNSPTSLRWGKGKMERTGQNKDFLMSNAFTT